MTLEPGAYVAREVTGALRAAILETRNLADLSPAAGDLIRGRLQVILSLATALNIDPARLVATTGGADLLWLRDGDK